MSRAIAGDPGEPQDEDEATYAAPFTEAECRLDWTEPGRTLQRKTVALNFPVLVRARAEIAGEVWGVRRVRPLAEAGVCGEPGSLVGRAGSVLTICAGDGPVEVEVEVDSEGRDRRTWADTEVRPYTSRTR
jgi:methionyl-tRNA formyltransferase